MQYFSSSSDFWYETTASALTYTISVDGQTIYWGKATKSPEKDKLRINVARRIRDYLSTEMPDFRDYDGVVVPHPEAMRVFSLTDGLGTVLEQYTVLLSDMKDWDGSTETLSDPINKHADPRQKIFWGCVSENERNVVIVPIGENYFLYASGPEPDAQTAYESGVTLEWWQDYGRAYFRTNSQNASAVTVSGETYLAYLSINNATKSIFFPFKTNNRTNAPREVLIMAGPSPDQLYYPFHIVQDYFRTDIPDMVTFKYTNSYEDDDYYYGSLFKNAFRDSGGTVVHPSVYTDPNTKTGIIRFDEKPVIYYGVRTTEMREITELILPDCIKLLTSECFKYSGSLSTLVCSGVTEIGSYAFRDSELRIDNLYFPNIDTIYSNTFGGLYYPLSITVSTKLTSIETRSFYFSSVREMYYMGTVQQWTENVNAPVSGDERITVHCIDGDKYFYDSML